MNDADAPAVVEAIRSQGFSMWCYADGDLFVPSGLSAAQRAFLRQHKPAVLAVLNETYSGGFLRELQE